MSGSSTVSGGEMSYYGSEDESASEASSEEVFREDMRVFLRLRPMNKLEQSRRSKNCIELHEDPTVITVDSPLEGEYDFVFDHVFEEYATQEEVYREAFEDVPVKLLDGFNCTVVAYGQTGTGKTHTMLGPQGGRRAGINSGQSVVNDSAGGGGSSTFEAPTNLSDRDESSASATEATGLSAARARLAADVDPETEGMIPRTVATIFNMMKEASPNVEFTVRCSYVEIYLEKILDLLHPQGTSSISLKITEDDEEADKAAGPEQQFCNVRIVGASELCCLNLDDVQALLARGNAARTMSATEMNMDSSRSHAVFILRLEQRNAATGRTLKSLLHMLDLAGSELASNQAQRTPSVVTNTTAAQVEATMINKSLAALQKLVRSQLDYQCDHESGQPPNRFGSKLTKLLRPSLGGNCMTTLILTASPSSYNIGETISTIRFGQRCRKILNSPVINEEESTEAYKRKWRESELQRLDALKLVRSLALECQSIADDSEQTDRSKPLWSTIDDIVKKSYIEEDAEDAGDLSFKVTARHSMVTPDEMEDGAAPPDGNLDADSPIEGLEQAMERVEHLERTVAFLTVAKDNAENALAELQSEVAVLRTQNENLTSDKNRNIKELVDAKNEVQMLSQRKLEVEHNLRTSQFRENEAIVFLRQFRRFYRNVLKDKAAHGAGTIKEITGEVADKVPNAPDLKELRDVDTLLLESGLIEEHELGEDRASGPTPYKPSKDALLRSAGSAQKAHREEQSIVSLSPTGSASDGGGDEAGTSALESPGARLASSSNGEHLETISELDQSGGISQYSAYSEDIDEKSSEDDKGNKERSNDTYEQNESDGRSGADAGAGSSAIGTDLPPSSYAHSISRGPQTGLMVTRRQKLLRTPSGRLTTMREKDLERELIEFSEKCIALQTALSEEKAIVDALTNKSGGLSKKRLAQEAISLRQQLEKKTASLTAIAWKMNELNLINKTYNEKMVNREQHVLYLEESLVDLQNTNRRLLVEKQETEKKLRDDIEQLQQIVDGMTVPLWQFGEAKMESMPVASRIVIPLAGGEDLHGAQRERRMSEGESEPSLSGDEDEEKEIPVADVQSPPEAPNVLTVDASTQTELEVEDVGIQTDKVETAEIEIQTEPEEKPLMQHTEVQTDDVDFVVMFEASGLPGKMTEAAHQERDSRAMVAGTADAVLGVSTELGIAKSSDGRTDIADKGFKLSATSDSASRPMRGDHDDAPLKSEEGKKEERGSTSSNLDKGRNESDEDDSSDETEDEEIGDEEKNDAHTVDSESIGLVDDFDYDNLGKRWGMSASDIAEDAAILTPSGRRRVLGEEMGSALGGNQEEHSEDEDVITDLVSEQPASLLDKAASLLGAGKAKAVQPEPLAEEPKNPATGQNWRLPSETDFKDYYGDNKDDDAGTLGDETEDFDKMMDETAKAIAAAEELLPTDDEIDTAYEESLAASMESINKYEDNSSLDDTYVSPEQSVRQKLRNKNSTQELKKELTPQMLEDGGKPAGHEPRRFFDKRNHIIKHAILKEGKKSLLPEYDEMSVVSSSLPADPLPRTKATSGVSRLSSSRDRMGHHRSRSSPISEDDPFDDSGAVESEDRKKKKKKRSDSSDDRKPSSSSRQYDEQRHKSRPSSSGHRRSASSGRKKGTTSSSRQNSSEDGSNRRKKKSSSSGGGEKSRSRRVR